MSKSQPSSTILVLVAGLVLLVGAFAMYGRVWPGKGSHNSPASVSDESATGNAVKQPDPGPLVREADPLPPPKDSGVAVSLQSLTIEQLFDALLAAAAASDEEALRVAREELLRRDKEAVVAHAQSVLQGLVQVTDRRVLGTAKLHAASAAYFIALWRPELILEMVRRYWGHPDPVAAETLDRWVSLNRFPVDHLASGALGPADGILAEALGVVLAMTITVEMPAVNALLNLLLDGTRSYESGGEVPDPWVSMLLTCLGRFNERFFSPVAKAWVLEWVGLIVSNVHFSERLKVQARSLFASVPKGYWEMLDYLGNADSVTQAAKALASYLSEHSLTDEETKQVYLALMNRFGAKLDDLRRFSQSLMTSGENIVPVERFQGFVDSLIRMALAWESGDGWLGTTTLLQGFCWSWGTARHTGVVPLSADPDLDVKMLDYARRAAAAKSPEYRIAAELAPGRAIAVIWLSGLTMERKFRAVLTIVRMFDEVPGAAYTAVLNGLAKVNEESLSEHRDLAGELVSETVSRHTYEKFVDPSQGKDALVKDSREAGFTRILGEALLRAGYPELSGTAKAVLLTMSRRVTAAPWAEETPVSRTVAAAQGLLRAYDQ